MISLVVKLSSSVHSCDRSSYIAVRYGSYVYFAMAINLSLLPPTSSFRYCHRLPVLSAYQSIKDVGLSIALGLLLPITNRSYFCCRCIVYCGPSGYDQSSSFIVDRCPLHSIVLCCLSCSSSITRFRLSRDPRANAINYEGIHTHSFASKSDSRTTLLSSYRPLR